MRDRVGGPRCVGVPICRRGLPSERNRTAMSPFRDRAPRGWLSLSGFEPGWNDGRDRRRSIKSRASRLPASRRPSNSMGSPRKRVIHVHLGRGKALRVIVDALEDRGYRWAYRVVNSLAFVPQRRERVFLVATKTEIDPANVLLVDERVPPSHRTTLDEHAHGFYWTEGTRGLGWAPNAVPTLKVGSSVGIPAPPAILMPDGRIITPEIRDAERLQGFPEDWTKPAEQVARKSVRWSLVGSAVTVPVAHWLGCRLAEPGGYDRGRDQQLPTDSRWPTAARFDGRSCWKVQISNFPVWLNRVPLASFLQHPGSPLSMRATRGFLTRADSSTLRFVDGFKDRIEYTATYGLRSRRDAKS